MATPSQSGRVRFDVFEIDLCSGELRKHGIKIKLHDQPFKVLTVLLEHSGEVVTREQLYQRLWPAGTFVDSDLGLNSAVMKLRDALGDSAEKPRFVETLPRRGYRLIVDVEVEGGTGNGKFGNFEAAINPADVPLGNGSSVAPSGHAELENPVSARRDEVALSPARPKVRPWFSAKAVIWTAILLVLAIGAWRLWKPAPGPYTIAVLPLENLSTEPGSDYFSDGLTDEIIQNLSIIDGLQVKSRTSSFAFKNKPRDIHRVGAEMGAGLVLDGSVLRAGDKLRVDVQLIRVSDDSPIWSGRYNREMKDIFEIQNEISRSIVNELRLQLGRGQRRYNTNLEAYDLYLKAKVLLNNTPGYGAEQIAASIPVFEQAIAKDPAFAPAYAGIGEAYASMSAAPRTFLPEVAYPKMKAACEKALELDPLLAEAHACKGIVYSRELAWGDAEKEFSRAIELNPNLSEPRQDFAVWVLFPLGKVDEALNQLHVARGLDPLSLPVVNSLSFLLMNVGRFDEVIENSRSAIAADPNNSSAQQLLGRALLQKGMLSEGIAILEKLDYGSESFLGYAYARAGRRDDAERMIKQHPAWPWLQAVVCGGLEDKDCAADGLEKMAEIKDPRTGIYLTLPEVALLRGDSRLGKIRVELGLPELP
jgi:TolB-like protein/DNA-binding winged helix-turn-helix (wHTH) protein